MDHVIFRTKLSSLRNDGNCDVTKQRYDWLNEEKNGCSTARVAHI